MQLAPAQNRLVPLTQERGEPVCYPSPVRLALRALAILLFVLIMGARFLVGWLVLLLAMQGKEKRQEWFGHCLVTLFRRLGATFIKVGQIMSTRPDLFPPHVIRALETLQDNVGPFLFNDVERTFREDLGKSAHDIFKEITPLPIASASVAQVHRAVLPDGRVVAVKVRRPKIAELVDFDLGVMRLGARLVGMVPSLGLLGPVESVDQFGVGIRMQLDFRKEADHNRRFRANFRNDPDVVFPELVEELCTSRILVMDFVDGQKMSDVIREVQKTDRARRKHLAEVGFRVMFKMIFEDGLVHADLHPGNLIVTSAGNRPKIAILDVGMVGEMTGENRAAFATYFAAWASGDGATMARIMAGFSTSADGKNAVPDYPGFERAVIEFVQRYHGKTLGEVQASLILLDMMNILRKYRVRSNPTFTLINIAMAVTEGIGKQLDPEVDLVATALPYFARLQQQAAQL